MHLLRRSCRLPVTPPIPAKITLAIRYTAAYKRKLRKANNASIYTNNPSPLTNKNKDNTYNRAYKPPTNVEEEGSNKDDSKKEEKDNSNDDSTSNSTSNSKDKARREPSNSGLYYKDILLYKQ
ncbi:hypothetical protein P8C59_006436 [Phyllachora maydis]|uniref:Uncharacterized protein n=1 Tax=Phyllachora maydis TaxID=1825666 RepID=A0AAD9MCJ0_9PEZI|nr:hypothetical protein P8C59_006436 [Phyllachora maydis]